MPLHENPIPTPVRIGVGGKALEADFCVDALQEALGQGRPEVFHTDQSLPPRRRTGEASSPAESSPKSFSDAG